MRRGHRHPIGRLAILAVATGAAVAPAAASAIEIDLPVVPVSASADLGVDLGSHPGVRASVGVAEGPAHTAALGVSGDVSTGGATAPGVGVDVSAPVVGADASAQVRADPGPTVSAAIDVGAPAPGPAGPTQPAPQLPAAPAPSTPPAAAAAPTPAPAAHARRPAVATHAAEPAAGAPAAATPAPAPASPAARVAAAPAPRTLTAAPAPAARRVPVAAATVGGGTRRAPVRARTAHARVGRIAAPAPHRAARVAAPRTVTLPITARHAPAVQRHDDGSLAQRALRVAVAAGRSPWALLALLFAIIGYAVVQRRIDGGSKLAAPGRSSAPDDELIEL